MLANEFYFQMMSFIFDSFLVMTTKILEEIVEIADNRLAETKRSSITNSPRPLRKCIMSHPFLSITFAALGILRIACIRKCSKIVGRPKARGHATPRPLSLPNQSGEPHATHRTRIAKR